jgi:hypothetical protein
MAVRLEVCVTQVAGGRTRQSCALWTPGRALSASRRLDLLPAFLQLEENLDSTSSDRLLRRRRIRASILHRHTERDVACSPAIWRLQSMLFR